MVEIYHLISIDADLTSVLALVQPEGFTQWWAEDVLEEDGAVHLGFFNRATVYRLSEALDVEYREAELMYPVTAWRCETGAEWSNTVLVFTPYLKDRKTFLHFTHTNWHEATEYFHLCNTTWGALMYRLKAAAEGKGAGPMFRTNGLAY